MKHAPFINCKLAPYLVEANHIWNTGQVAVVRSINYNDWVAHFLFSHYFIHYVTPCLILVLLGVRFDAHFVLGSFLIGTVVVLAVPHWSLSNVTHRVQRAIYIQNQYPTCFPIYICKTVSYASGMTPAASEHVSSCVSEPC
ncbi:hypothetical protein BJ912DRAFT_164728 [Pholiota molesta]|nr:hypothetical protein BJ912DRAFT_164728 [Pholiota molesta]